VIAYFDASALVKRWVQERGTEIVQAAFESTAIKVTAMTSGAEVPAALSLAVRAGRVSPAAGESALRSFWQEWPSFARVYLSELTARQAGDLAWNLGLRGYDAVHLASALAASTMAGEAATVVTFDRQLWRAAQQEGLPVIPQDIEPYLSRQRQGPRSL